MRLAFLIALSLFMTQAMAKIESFTLSNGLKVVVKEDHRAPVVVSMIWYNVGSADEPGGITGISHVLEHLMFKGTPAYPQGQFSQIIAAAGGQENAFTYYDYTAYFEKTAASHLAVNLALEADRMQNLQFNPASFEKEMAVIKEERRLRTDDNPKALTFERFLATAHLTDPYHHPVIGWMEDLNTMKLEDAKAWYENFYTPNNATLVVVGDIDTEQVHTLSENAFGSIKRHPDFIRKQQIEPKALGEKTTAVYAEAQLPLLIMGYTVPSLVTTHNPKEAYTLEVIAALLDAGDSGRLTQQLIKKQKLATDLEASYSLYSRYQTQFSLLGIPAAGHTIPELKNALLKELNRLSEIKVSEEELSRVKTALIAEKTFEKDSIFEQAMEIGLLETLGLGYQTAEQYAKNIQSITTEDINMIAKQYFVPHALTSAQLYPRPFAKEHP